ncbi:phage tail protein [Streptococcus sanguinis]|uniref:phage tail protein n=1 Tax=Streptococcus sanguinis TaxID=1305 RepID=UPI001697AF54|nr:PblA [Streptococcus sanguinis]KAF1308137.1 PblA [Streptococcus sanguinis OH0843]
MATELGQAYVQIMPSAKGISGMIKNAIAPEASAAGQSAGMTIGSSIASIATKVIAAAGIGKAFSAAISEGANLQQSLGGIDTLFKDSAEKVKGYANEAFRTAGLSANAYMENVTGFSASLLQSLGGDTAKAADVANMAMIDMSDNANKMGTSMDRIQDAYQGFAKQNYTMLDNLKLGYGGTKTEMERLLADAEKLTGVKYDINNLADVYQAIHAIQGQLDITGTTAKEASSTFSGSFAAMKASAQNVLGKLALGENVLPALQALLDTTSTFLFNNFIPMISNVFSGLGLLLTEGLSKVASQLFGEAFGSAVYSQLSKVSGVFQTFFDMLFGSLNKQDNIDILEALGFSKDTASQIVNIADNIRGAFENIGAIIGNVSEIVGGFVSDLLGIGGSEQGVSALGTAFEVLSGGIKFVSGILKSFTDFIKKNEFAVSYLKSVLTGLLTAFLAFKAVSAFTTAITVAKGAVIAFNAAIVANPIGAIVAAIAGVVAALTWFFTQTKTGQKIWAGFVSWIKDAWQGISDFFSGLWSGISDGAKKIWSGVQAVWAAHVEAVKAIWNGVTEFFSNLWNGIKSAFTSAWTAITQAVMTIVQPFIDVFISLWNNVKDGLSKMWDGVKMVFQGAWEFIKSIVMGAALIIIDLLTGNFSKLGEDMGLIWDSIKNAISMVWEGLKLYFSGVVDAIVGYVKTVFETLVSALQAVWDSITSAASAAWEWLKTTITNIITGFISGAIAAWEGFKNALSSLWNGLKATAEASWNALKTAVVNVINGLVQGAQKAWDDLKNGVSNAVSSVTKVFDGLKKINLFEAGKAIIDGFLKGLKGAFDNVKNFVGGIADWIRENKGPIEYDRKLLIPHGRAIMDSLNEGLQDRFKDTKSLVSGMAGEMSDIFEQTTLTGNVALTGSDGIQDSIVRGSYQLDTLASSEFEKLSKKVDELSERALDIAEKALERPVQMVLDDNTLVAKTGSKFMNWQSEQEEMMNRMRGVII